MKTALTLFFLEAIEAFIGTVEILYISQAPAWKASLVSALNVTVSMLGFYIFVTSDNPLLMIIPCVLGNTAATYIAIKVARRRK